MDARFHSSSYHGELKKHLENLLECVDSLLESESEAEGSETSDYHITLKRSVSFVCDAFEGSKSFEARVIPCHTLSQRCVKDFRVFAFRANDECAYELFDGIQSLANTQLTASESTCDCADIFTVQSSTI